MILDVDKAADFLGVSTETIRILARNKRIPSAKIGRQWRFQQEDLISFLRSQYEPTKNTTGSNEQAGVPAQLDRGMVGASA
jgi:excisionase family DNA binding protein